MRGHTGLRAALLVLGAAIGGCGGAVEPGTPTTATVEVIVRDPDGAASQATYKQLVLISGVCPNDSALVNGKFEAVESIQEIPQFGTAFDVSDLEFKKIAFVGVLRRDDCAVLAVGCTSADLAVHKHITVEVDSVIPPAGACASSQSCVDGQCK
ncbi:MAG: hypothetical protein HY898_22640 [Deltaproteobacteria bacterium]|nr:hypothetical protein [Deltaproteobacteria bacterium]